MWPWTLMGAFLGATTLLIYLAIKEERRMKREIEKTEADIRRLREKIAEEQKTLQSRIETLRRNIFERAIRN